GPGRRADPGPAAAPLPAVCPGPGPGRAAPGDRPADAEGWNVASIARYLQVNRRRVYETLRRWIDEGVRGLEDKPPIPKRPARKADLAAMNAIRKLQENPELGEFRIHAALRQLGIHLSPRTRGRIL